MLPEGYDVMPPQADEKVELFHQPAKSEPG